MSKSDMVTLFFAACGNSDEEIANYHSSFHDRDKFATVGEVRRFILMNQGTIDTLKELLVKNPFTVARLWKDFGVGTGDPVVSFDGEDVVEQRWQEDAINQSRTVAKAPDDEDKYEEFDSEEESSLPLRTASISAEEITLSFDGPVEVTPLIQAILSVYPTMVSGLEDDSDG